MTKAQGIALDRGNNIYVTGFTGSTNFPTTNYVNQIIGTNLYDGHWLNGFTNKNVTFPYDAFLTKLAPSGTNIVYSTLLGGVNNDQANHVAVDGSGAAYVTGWTVSTNFPNTMPTNLIANRLTNNIKSLTTTNTFLTKITNGAGTSAGIAYSVVLAAAAATSALALRLTRRAMRSSPAPALRPISRVSRPTAPVFSMQQMPVAVTSL